MISRFSTQALQHCISGYGRKTFRTLCPFQSDLILTSKAEGAKAGEAGEHAGGDGGEKASVLGVYAT